jgi:phosphinothricin acetyltransferase
VNPLSETTVRLAEEHDSKAIRTIRNHAIDQTTAIWTTHTQTSAEARAWLAEHLARRSMYVAEVDGQVVGFACWGPWHQKEGYRHTVENSVYVLDAYRGHGIGHQLMTALITAARDAGAHAIVANVEAANDSSLALHRRLGYATIGTLPQVGTKFGRWLDLTIMHLPL